MGATRRTGWPQRSLEVDGALSVSNRALVAPDLSIRTNELRLAYDGDLAEIEAAHLWVRSDPLDGRGDDVNELSLDAAWRIGAELERRPRRALRLCRQPRRARRARRRLAQRCLTVDLSLSRRFTSSTSVDAQTTVGLEVSLLGFGAGGSGRAAAPRLLRMTTTVRIS